MGKLIMTESRLEVIRGCKEKEMRNYCLVGAVSLWGDGKVLEIQW